MAGYAGSDSMRDNAEKMLKLGCKTYKKGGHCYDNGGSVDLNTQNQNQLPQQTTPPQQYGSGAQGQPQPQYGFGGVPRPAMQTIGSALKKGGKVKRAGGGKMEDKMEKRACGDPSQAMRTAPMTRKEGGTMEKRACGGKMEKRAEGGEMKKTDKYAMGGVAKLRHGEMNLKGMPTNRSSNVGLKGNRLPLLERNKRSV